MTNNLKKKMLLIAKVQLLKNELVDVNLLYRAHKLYGQAGFKTINSIMQRRNHFEARIKELERKINEKA